MKRALLRKHWVQRIDVFLKCLIVPLMLTILALRYLLKPGYAGFVDNNGLAPTLTELVNIILYSPWGFWYVPGAIIPAILESLLNNRVLAWKISVLIYQYLSFIVAYKALSVLKNIVHEKNFRNKYVELVAYLLALSYSFNVYIIGGLFNYYLYQFQLPQIFAPLYIVYLIELIHKFRIQDRISIKSVIAKSSKLILTGFLISTSPPMVAMCFIVLLIIYLNTVLELRNDLRKIVMITCIIFMILILSNLYSLVKIFILGTHNPSIQRFLIRKIYYTGYPLIHVLTFSYKAIDVNKNNIVVIENITIPSSLFIYMPFTLILYSTLVRPKIISSHWYRIILSYMIAILIIFVFMNGFSNNSLGSLLYAISKLLPNFFLSTFVNNLTNLQHVFAIAFVYVSLWLLLLLHAALSKRHRTLTYMILLITITMAIPIIINFFYIHLVFYAHAVSPTPVPHYYNKVFDFIRQHSNATYLWIPQYGLLKWRGSFLSDIPGYLGGRKWVGGYFETPHKYIKGDDYVKIVVSLKNGQFPYELFKKHSVKYIIICTDYLMRNQKAWDTIVGYVRNNPQYFNLIAVYGTVEIYEVKIAG